MKEHTRFTIEEFNRYAKHIAAGWTIREVASHYRVKYRRVQECLLKYASGAASIRAIKKQAPSKKNTLVLHAPPAKPTLWERFTAWVLG